MTYFANRAREVHALARVSVREMCGSEVVRRNTLLDPAHDSVEYVVLCIVHERRIRVSRCAKRCCAEAALVKANGDNGEISG